MNKKLLWALLFLISVFTYSCVNDDIEISLDEKKGNEYFVTQERAKEIAGSILRINKRKALKEKF